MMSKRDFPDRAAMTSACVNDGNSPSRAKFEVFLSFRGPDTRLNFTDCLYHSLVRAGMRVFRDDEEIRKGEKIAGELLHAIKASKIYMPIFSRDYASSVWCLRELRHIVECSSKANDKVILPIFYEVDPDDVKLKTRLYLDALEKHEEKFSCDVRQWKEALMEVARIEGWATKNEGQGGIIDTIVDEVFTKLNKKNRNLPDHLVGIHNRVEAIMDLLNKGSHDVSYLVIHGMGGIGKTTLASAIYNQISTEFQGSSFISDIRESVCHGRIIELQKQLISEILQHRDLPLYSSVDAGINILRKRFRDKKVLIILDDVDKRDQLSKLAGKSDWFGPGSKIIITTRDINFLPIKEDGESSFQAHFEEFKIYEMMELNSSHALHLFSKHAFGMDFPPHDYDDISRKITGKTSGLPLALEVIGSSLSCKSKMVWKATLKKLVLVPPQEVFDKLKISYDMLQPRQREIFLDIVCYFIGKERLCPYYMWKASNYFPKIEVSVLARMSLIKIKFDEFWMHDQLRDFGREIIQHEDIDVPGRRSRLWEPEIALKVVQMKEGTDKVVALNLSGLSKMYTLTSEVFSKLPNLRFLELQCWNLVGDFKNLLSKLIWLSWTLFPSKLKATNLHLKKLVVLKLYGGFMSEDWTGWEPCLVSENLKVIEINCCQSFKRIPKFLKCSNLKKLVLRSGTLLAVDGFLSKQESLKHLEICSLGYPPNEDCEIFTPSILYSLKSLSTLKIGGMHVRGLHHSIGEMTRLEYLSLERCCLLETLPESIGKLKSLLELELDSMETTGLPHSIGDLKMLRKMSLVGTWIKKPPDQMGVTPKIEWIEGLSNLEVLVLAMKEFTFPPINLATLSWLWRLEITLVDPRSLMGLPSRLSILVLYNVKSPIESSLFSNLTNLSSLSLRDCWLREVDFDDVLGQHPEKLHRLLVTNDQLLERLSLSKLKGLQSLAVSDCPGLLEIQGGEKLESLEGLFISRCSSLERLPDLSELKKLQNLQIYDCPLTNSPGLRLQDTCSLIFARCGISAHFLGKYKEWKDTYGHSGDDINGQL